MNNKKSTKRALLTSVLSLVICMTMLIGTTFAWFTDSVTSSGNIIKSGNLDVSFEWLTGDKDPTATDAAWVDASTGAIFDYDKWEPGYTSVRHIKIENEGSLALKYKVQIMANGVVSKLADVIDVYYIDPATGPVSDRTDLKDENKIGTLSKVLADMETSATGSLLEGEKDVITLALKMQESAGNEYQDLAIGTDFSVVLRATQVEAEEDSFDNTYDALADYDGDISNTASLEAAFKAGGNYQVIADFTIPEGTLPTVAEGKTVALDLNGHSITAENTGSQYAFNNLGELTIWDSKAASSTTYSLRSSSAGSVSARGIYNGYNPDGDPVTTAKLTILSGVYNAQGNGGGAAIFNYGTVDIKGGTFTSVASYALNNQAGGSMTIANANVDGGIYNLGGLVINGGDILNTRSGCHTVYHAGTTLTINGGTFDNTSRNEVINSASNNVTINDGTFIMTGKSYLFGGNGIVINGGNFFGYVNADGTNDKMRSGVVAKGGTFNFDVSSFVDSGYQSVSVGDNYMVLPSGYEVVSEGLYKDEEGAYQVVTGAGLSYFNQNWGTLANKATVINLIADVDFTGYTWTPLESHADTKTGLKEINGNGHTIENLTVNGQAMFKRFAGTGDVTIKDITFDNASVNSNGKINTSILTVQSYQNVLLDNVDVVNSTINGGYKVAPLIATVYNESSSTVTATLKNCDVKNCVVKATSYDFCTAGLVAFANAGDNDKVVFENCTVEDVTLIAPDDGYKAHAFVYTTGSGSLYDEAEGVTVANCKFEVLK